MLEEGYAAVTSRKIANRAGLPNAIHYYFEDMDDLFIELFRRGAARSLARQEEALASPQPLWAFWDLLMDRSNGDLTTEFIALANHRKAIRSEIAESSRTFRRAQLAALNGLATTSPEATVLLLERGLAFPHYRERLRPRHRTRPSRRVRRRLHPAD